MASPPPIFRAGAPSRILARAAGALRRGGPPRHRNEIDISRTIIPTQQYVTKALIAANSSVWWGDEQKLLMSMNCNMYALRIFVASRTEYFYVGVFMAL